LLYFFFLFSKKDEDEKKKDATENRPTIFQRDRVDLLLQEFSHRFPPFKNQQESQKSQKSAADDDEINKEQENPMGPPSVQDNKDQPVEKKMKLNNR
jgi:hypothetical protein